MTGDTTPTRPITPAPAPAPAPRNPIVTGWMIAVGGLIVAAFFGFLLMWVGSNRMKSAKQLEQPYHLAFGYIANDADIQIKNAEGAIKSNNWGEAQDFLNAAGQAISSMELATSDPDKDRVHQIRITLGEVQTAVGNRDPSAADKADNLSKQLEGFIVK